jgi:lysophospholipase L1-like esterase
LEKEVDLDLPAKSLKTILSGRNVEWLDLNDLFKRKSGPGRSGHYRYDGHWNSEGHRWVAEALVPFIKTRMLSEKS